MHPMFVFGCCVFRQPQERPCIERGDPLATLRPELPTSQLLLDEDAVDDALAITEREDGIIGIDQL